MWRVGSARRRGRMRPHLLAWVLFLAALRHQEPPSDPMGSDAEDRKPLVLWCKRCGERALCVFIGNGTYRCENDHDHLIKR